MITFLLSFMSHDISDEEIHRELELHILQWKEYRKEAEEIVRDRGWSEKDDDFEIQIEQEAKRLWEEESEREQEREQLWQEEC